MAREVIQILGQVKPGTAAETDLYVVPEGRRAVISRLYLFNEDAGASLVKIVVSPGGTTTAPQYYLVNGKSIPTKDDFYWEKITLDEFDEIRVESDTGSVVFHAYGVEILPEKT